MFVVTMVSLYIAGAFVFSWVCGRFYEGEKSLEEVGFAIAAMALVWPLALFIVLAMYLALNGLEGRHS